MIKIILAIVVVLLLGYLGYGFEKYYKTRLKILNDYNKFLIFTEQETAFLKSSVTELIERFEYSSTKLKEILTKISNGEVIDCIYLNKDITNAIKRFLDELSKADYYFKDKVILGAKNNVLELIKQAEKDQTQKGEMGRKLIILLGIGLIIMII